MSLLTILLIAVAFVAYGLFSNKLSNSSLTAPLFFSSVGLIYGLVQGPMAFHIDREALYILAEITLVLVLFVDASTLRWSQLRKDSLLPRRLLTISLPLSILVGALLGFVLFPALSIWEAALIAAILAPTDAALGQIIVSSRYIPERVRQGLNIESGLNDGFSLPIILMFACFTSVEHAQQYGLAYWLVFLAKQVFFGIAAGVAVGWLSATLINGAIKRDSISEVMQGISTLALIAIAYVAAELIHGNGFVAVFVAGLVFGNRLQEAAHFLSEFTESEGQLLTSLTFLVFAAVMLPAVVLNFQWMWLVYALLSLTLIRMLPSAIALIGAGCDWPTKFLIGWFGPRGLASLLFLLLVLRDTMIPNSEVVVGVVLTTVMLSIVLHGVSAAPAAKRFGQYLEQR